MHFFWEILECKYIGQILLRSYVQQDCVGVGISD